MDESYLAAEVFPAGVPWTTGSSSPACDTHFMICGILTRRLGHPTTDMLEAMDFFGWRDLEGWTADCLTSVAFDPELVAVMALLDLDDPLLKCLAGSWRTSSGASIKWVDHTSRVVIIMCWVSNSCWVVIIMCWISHACWVVHDLRFTSVHERGENRSERQVDMVLCAGAAARRVKRGLNFIVWNFAWDLLASGLYAATATTILMKFTFLDI